MNESMSPASVRCRWSPRAVVASCFLLGASVLWGVPAANADTIVGSVVLNGSWNMELDVTVTDTEVTIEMTGPDGVWFGVGFDATQDANAYSIIVDGDGTVQERKLGNHAAGTLLSASISVQSNTATAGVRTVVLTRPLAVGLDYFEFSTSLSTLDVIYARGTTSSLAFHGSSNMGSKAISFGAVPVELQFFRIN